MLIKLIKNASLIYNFLKSRDLKTPSNSNLLPRNLFFALPLSYDSPKDSVKIADDVQASCCLD